MKQVELVNPTFTQSPFFVFNEETLKEFLERFAQMTCLNFGPKAEFEFENKLFCKPEEFYQKDHHKKVKGNVKEEDQEDGLDLEDEGPKERIQIAEKMLNHKVPIKLQEKDLNILSRPLTPVSKYGDILKGTPLGQEADEDNSNLISLIRDPFSELQIAGTTMCLLGQNDKVLYINDRGDSELMTLEFEFTHPAAKKGYILKNFGCCTFFDRNKVIYSGGGPSNEVYLLEFKTKKNVMVTPLPNMSHKRCWHGSVYVRPYVYVLGT